MRKISKYGNGYGIFITPSSKLSELAIKHIDANTLIYEIDDVPVYGIDLDNTFLDYIFYIESDEVLGKGIIEFEVEYVTDTPKEINKDSKFLKPDVLNIVSCTNLMDMMYSKSEAKLYVFDKIGFNLELGPVKFSESDVRKYADKIN